jgi:transposase InsO family protein
MADNSVICSMSRLGNVWDNAAMESFFSLLKTERTGHKRLTGRKSGCRCIRLHRTLVQSQTQELDDRVPESYRVRTTGWISLSG